MAALAKLTRPILHQVVPRERLFARLDRCRERPLVWVAGPPGAGKTALVASWIAARKIGGCWIHLDSGDRELSTFFFYLSAAAAPARKRAPPLPLLGPEHRADLAAFARLYFRALFAPMKTPAVIVLDNYHELPDDAPLHGLLDAIAREAPDGCAVLAISREDPPPACAALRALERIATLDWDELKLTLDESRAIAALRHAPGEETLRRAHELAGGWPVGLTLTLEQARRRGEDSLAGGAGGREVLFQYFAGQIFASLDPSARDTLARCALLPRATAAQAGALLGDASAGALLERLYRARMFVDKRGDAYQFHDLFRDFLLERFALANEPAQAARLRAAAIALLRDSDQHEDAFALAASAELWDAAVAIVLDYAPRLFEYGRLPTLGEWLRTLPPDRFDAIPWLGLWRAVALSNVSPAQARAAFAATYARFEAGREDLARVLCIGGLLISHYLEFDDFAPIEPWIDVLIPLLEQRLPLPLAAELRVNSALLFALSFRRPRQALLAPAIARIHALFATDIPINARLDAAALLLSHHINCTEFDAAAQLVAMVETWLAKEQPNAFYRVFWRMQLGRFEANRGPSAPGRAILEEALAIARENAIAAPLPYVFCLIGLADLALLEGDVAGAEESRVRLGRHWSAARKIDTMFDAGLRSRIAGHRGDTVLALACAREQIALADAIGVQWQCFRVRIQLAFALLDAGNHAAVPALIGEVRALLEGTVYASAAYQLDLIEAYAALLDGDEDAALAPLARGLAGSRADAGLFALRQQPGVLPRLFGFALERGVDRDYVRATIRRLGIRAPDADARDWPWPLEVRTFGRFEVLRDGEPLEFSRKIPKKTLALLKALVALGAGVVSEQRLIDAFWSDEEGDAAARSLDATVLRLRALLGDARLIEQRGGKVSLDLDRAWVDAFAFERALTARGDRASLERAVALYAGAFLADDDGDAWPVATRERLRGRFIHALVELGARHERDNELDAAIAAYQRGIDADSAVEPFYQGLMRCYDKLDRRTEAIAAYRRLKQTLSITLGIKPSAATERLYESLRAS